MKSWPEMIRPWPRFDRQCQQWPPPWGSWPTAGWWCSPASSCWFQVSANNWGVCSKTSISFNPRIKWSKDIGVEDHFVLNWLWLQAMIWRLLALHQIDSYFIYKFSWLFRNSILCVIKGLCCIRREGDIMSIFISCWATACNGQNDRFRFCI